MKQEDWNDLVDKHPGPELVAQVEEYLAEARSRRCRCADRPGGHDQQCNESGHTMESQTIRPHPVCFDAPDALSETAAFIPNGIPGPQQDTPQPVSEPYTLLQPLGGPEELPQQPEPTP